MHPSLSGIYGKGLTPRMNWKNKINWKYMQISIYVIITVLIIYALSLILKSSPKIINQILDKLSWVIGVIKPVIIGFAFAYILDPIVNFFDRRYQKLKTKKFFSRIVAPRTWAAITAVLLVIIAISGLISLLVFAVTDQIRLANLDDLTRLIDAYKENLDGFYKTLLAKLKEFDIQSQQFEQYVATVTASIATAIMNLTDMALTSITNISSYFTTIFFSFIIGFYFMIDGRMFLSYIKKVCQALFSENLNRKMTGMVHDLDEVFSGYIRGQLTDAVFMMFLISITLSIIGVKFAILIGVFAGIGNLIPYFGPIVAYVSTSIVCLMNGDIKLWVISMIALLVIQAIDGNLIGPKLLSQSIQIHPLIIIISLIFGSAVGGFLGMLLAVPVGAYIKLVIVRFVDRRLEYKGLNK